MKTWTLVRLIVVLTLSAAACDRGADPGAAAERAGGTAVVCIQGAPERLNPFVSPDLSAADLLPVLYTPLVLYDGAGGFRPHLATEWAWSDERRALRLHLRRDVRWHDGEPVDAEDVAWTLRRAADPDYGYYNGVDFAPLESVEVLGEVELEIRFRQPYVLGLEPFAVLPILPRHVLDGMPPDEFQRADYHRAPVGSGPFRFTGRAVDGMLRFERAETFPPELGAPGLDRLVIRPIPEPTTVAIELETGGVHLCVTAVALASELQRTGRIQLHALEPAQISALPLNTRRPPLDDPRVRRALSASLHRSDIAASVSPLARPARSLLPVESPWLDPELGQPDARPELAAELLESAGWRTGPDGIRQDADGRPLRFTIVAPQTFRDALVRIQSQFRDVGVAVDLRFMEWAAYVGLITGDDRPDAMALGLADRLIAPDYSDLLGSGGGMNLAYYSSVAADSVLARLTVAADPGERGELYRELQRRIAEDVPIVYYGASPRLAAIGPRLTGFRPDLNGPFASVSEWRLTDARRPAP
jgi:peptide/nickel transport system substrate-binding protein